MTSPPFAVQERDIDLLILEQAHVSPSFLAWLAERAGLTGAELERGQHSVYRDHGETDVLLILRVGADRVALMIEDKIGAPLQPRQGERYHERGRDLCTRGEADRYLTALCAPRSYLANVPSDAPWQVRLSFEDLEAWFAADPSPAAAWRRAILATAASKATRARQADDRSSVAFDPAIVSLKEAYRRLVEEHCPDLIATLQEKRDREYYLKARVLPSGIRLKHAFFRGEVSLVLERRWAERVGADALAAMLPEAAWVVLHGSETHVRLAVEVLDPALSLDAQGEVALAVLDAVRSLVPLGERIARLGA